MPSSSPRLQPLIAAALFVVFALGADRPEPPGAGVRSFDADPGWDGHRNRLVPEKLRVVRQHFGYRRTNKAGGSTAGEVGGWVQRSVTPAYYALPIEPRTLDDRLSFSGRFAVHQDESSTGTLVGFFNDKLSRGWRTPHSLAVRIDGNGGKFWVFLEYGTRDWRTGCKGCFEGDAYQTTKTPPFRADGTPHDFNVTYDPAGAAGRGLITLVLDGKEYPLTLDEGHKADGATFNRFGVWNQHTTGGGMEVYFDDLVVQGEPLSFDKDPGWEGKGNDVEYEDRVLRPFHDFGYSPTNHAGGRSAGEIGGIVWRDEKPAYCADKVRPLTLDHELFASGKLAFTGAGSDSGVYFGWFNSESKRGQAEPEYKQPQRNNLGVLIEGPSRVGHYFRPSYRVTSGDGAASEAGPVIRPDGTAHDWSIHYDPGGAAGNGRITVKFDGNVQTLDLKPGEKKQGATFDRFGIFNLQAGGHHVYVYFDDLTYTAEPPAAK